MPSHPVVTFDFAQAWMSLFKISLICPLAFPGCYGATSRRSMRGRPRMKMRRASGEVEGA
jgi:hypothetical protein